MILRFFAGVAGLNGCIEMGKGQVGQATYYLQWKYTHFHLNIFGCWYTQRFQCHLQSTILDSIIMVK